MTKHPDLLDRCRNPSTEGSDLARLLAIANLTIYWIKPLNVCPVLIQDFSPKCHRAALD